VLKNEYTKCELKKENVFLKEHQKKEIEAKLDFKISSLILRYSYPCSESFIYVDSHLVRTLNETTLVEISKTNLKSIQIASFMEPTQYLPPKKWLDKLSLNEKIDGLTGATLSQNAILNVVKKYKVI